MNLPPIISKILYAILVSPLQANHSTVKVSQLAPEVRKSSYGLTISTVHFVDRLIPGVPIADRLSLLMYRDNCFPWTPVGIHLIAFGSGTAVFKIDWKNGSKVLRIYRKSLGRSLNGLLEIARHYKRNYDIVHSWYVSSPDLVLPMDFLIIYGLPFANPVAASLQPFIHGQKYDFFEDFSDEQLVKLLQGNELLRGQFLIFAEQTIKQWEGQKMCFDFLGKQNLMLVNHGGNYNLRIADVGIFNFDVIAKKYPHKREKIMQRITRLISLYKSAKEM